MNQPGSEHDKPHDLDEFLDRQMDESARLRFQQRLERDADLRAEVEQQRAIDERLRERFTPPSAQQAAAQLPVKRVPQHTTNRFQQLVTAEVRFRHVAAAAIILLVIGLLIWQLWPESPKAGRVAPYYANLPLMTVGAFYQNRLENGFQPDWECPPDEFQRVCLAQLDHALTYGISVDSEVTMAGVAYSNTISERTVVMLAHAKLQPIMVFIDRADHDPARKPAIEPGKNLKLFSVQLGGLVLYELSPLDRSYVLPMFHEPPKQVSCPGH